MVSKRIRVADQISNELFGATDGTISTLAVVAGVWAATSNPFFALVGGISAMTAEALSMGFSSYIAAGTRETILKTNGKKKREEVIKNALLFWGVTMGGGFVPLVPFVLKFPSPLMFSLLFSVVFLFLMGVHSAKYTKQNPSVAGLKIMVVGLIATLVTYAVGYAFSPIAPPFG